MEKIGCKMADKTAVKRPKQKRKRKQSSAALGRPTKMTPAVVRKLEQAFCWEWSDEKACDYAGISKKTLWVYEKAHPDFTQRKQMLRSHPSHIAKMNIVNALENGDLKASQWYLERRDPQFSSKKQVDVSVEHKISEEQLAINLQQLLDKIKENQNDEDIIDVESSEIKEIE